jgi:hypothetical protein
VTNCKQLLLNVRRGATGEFASGSLPSFGGIGASGGLHIAAFQAVEIGAEEQSFGRGDDLSLDWSIDQYEMMKVGYAFT